MRAMTFPEWLRYTYGTTFVPPDKFAQYQHEYSEYLAKFQTDGPAPDSPGVEFTDETPAGTMPGAGSIVPPGTDWLTQALNNLASQLQNILSDEKTAIAVMAAGLAAGSTWTLFYTNTVETAAGQLGGIMQGIGSIPPENLSLQIGL